MATSEELAALVSSESARLLEYFKGLSEDDWATQSACEAWNNADVVAHMTMAVDMFSGNIERGANGDSSPPEGMGPPEEFDLAGRMAANAARAVAMRESLGETLVEAFSQNCDRLNALMARMGPDDWQKSVLPPRVISEHQAVPDPAAGGSDHSRMGHPVAAGRFGTPAGRGGRGAPGVAARIVVGRFFLPGSEIATPSRFRFDLTDGGSHDIVAGGGELRMEDSTPDAADVTFSCSASTFALLAYGRITVEGAVASGDITVEGDRALAMQF